MVIIMDQIRKNLIHLYDECSVRRLNDAAKWAAEMLLCFTSETTESSCSSAAQATVVNLNLRMALACFDCQEFNRAHDFSVRVSPETLQSTFIQYYSLYLSGEKRRLDNLADASCCSGGKTPKYENEELAALQNRLEQRKSETSQSDGFLDYLYGLVLRDRELPSLAIDAFVSSLKTLPWFWPSWHALSALIDSNQQLESLSLPDHWMKRLCYGSSFQRLNMLNESLAEYETLIDAGLSRSTYVLTQMAAVKHTMQDHDGALNLFQQVHSFDANRIEEMDKYSNTLFVKGMRIELATLAHHFFDVNKFTPETCNIVGNYYSLREEHDKAVVYFQRALKLDPSNASAWTLMGHEYMELKKTSAACLAYRNALAVDSKDFRAWYGLGELYEILKLTTFASYYYNMAHRCSPEDSRVLVALGDMYSKQNRLSDAVKCYWRAHCVQDIEGVALMKLAKLFEKQSEEEQAASCYLKFLTQTERRLRELAGGGDDETFDVPMDEDGMGVSCRFLAQYWLKRGELDDAHRYALRCLEFNATKEDGRAFLKNISNARTEQQRVVTDGEMQVDAVVNDDDGRTTSPTDTNEPAVAANFATPFRRETEH